MKKILVLFISLLMFLPLGVNALNKNYKDVVSNIVGEKVEENKINIYLFYSSTCPHCHDEIEYLKDVKKKYGNKINIYKYEVTENRNNNVLMNTVKSLFDFDSNGVPFTVIGEEYIFGFSESSTEIEDVLDKYIDSEKEVKEKKYNLPILGKISASSVNVSLVAVVLGFIDGFNPCAMWILLLLINMCISLKSRKKMVIIGLTFIFTSGFIYFLSMLGIGLILDLTVISYIRNIIALVAIGLGIYNLYIYFKTRKETGCHVVDKKKRKRIITRLDVILATKTTFLMILGTIILASSVNLVELACSLGFPTIFLEILSINNITGLSKILYLLIYIFFYLIDDLVIFLIAVFTLKSKGISTKYNKFVNLVGGILMIIMGILLIFKPEWVMLNF